MVYFILAVCLISPASSFNFTLDGIIKLERDIKYAKDVRSARHAFQENRAIVLESEDEVWKPTKSFSEETESLEDHRTKKRKRHSTKDPPVRNLKDNDELRLRGSHLHETKYNYYENDDSDQYKKYNYNDQDDNVKEDDYDENSGGDDDDKNNYSLRFTRPLKQIQRDHGRYTKHHKKGKDDFDSTEKWHQEHYKDLSDSEDRDAFENKYFYNEAQTTNKVLLEDTTKMQSFFQNKSANDIAALLKNKTLSGKQLIQNIKNDSKYGEKFNKLLNESKPAAMFVEKLENNTFLQSILMQYAKDEKSIDKLMQMLNQTATKTDRVSNKTNSWVEKLKNTTVFDSIDNWKQKFKNKTHESLNIWKQKIKNDTRDSINSLKQIIKNKTLNAILNKNDYFSTTSKIESIQNRGDENTDKIFHSTKHMIVDSQEKISLATEKLNSLRNEISKISQNLHKMHNKTRVEFANLYNELNKEPFKIQDNDVINDFTKHILTRTLKLFDDVEKRSTEYRWKKKMKYLARSYEDKFNEFLRASKQHTIRTRMGTRKVILNAIDVSNRIVKRLLDFMTDDMEKRGLTYNNLTPQIFRSEISKEEDWELKRACKKLKICRSQKGFLDFIIDVLTTILRVSNTRFKPAFSSIIDAAKIANLAFEPNIKEGMKRRLDYYNRQDVHVQRGMLMIVKNIIVNRNSPLILYADTSPRESKIVQSTLAFLEIINTLDEKVSTDKRNRNDWNNLKQKFNDWANGKTENLQNTSMKFMTVINNAINDTDEASKQIISRNANTMFA